jgi:diphthine-ammonia ligase
MATVATSSLQRSNWVAVSNVQANGSPSEFGMTLEEEVTECFQILTSRFNNFMHDFKNHHFFLECLTEYDLDLSNCVNINLFIQSMDLFGRVNAVYSKFFGSNAPARACVGVDLPENIRVRLDCIVIKEQNSSDRQSLHVQGLSYWAPANIGPYSQAITVRKVLLSSSTYNLKCKFRLVNVYLYQVKLDSSPVNLLSHLRAPSPQSSH